MSNVFTALTRLCVGGQPTTVMNPAGTANLPVSATFEVTGTTGALLLPRLTTDQINGTIDIPSLLDNENSTITPGMQVYDTDQNEVLDYTPNGWVAETTTEGFLVATHEFDNFDIQQMFGAPRLLIAAPAANQIISIQQMSFYLHSVQDGATAYTAGGNIYVGYGAAVTPPLADIVRAIDNDIASTVLTANTISSVTFNWGRENNALVPKEGTLGLSVYMSNLGMAFGDGIHMHVNVSIYYNIVTVAI